MGQDKTTRTTGTSDVERISSRKRKKQALVEDEVDQETIPHSTQADDSLMKKKKKKKRKISSEEDSPAETELATVAPVEPAPEAESELKEKSKKKKKKRKQRESDADVVTQAESSSASNDAFLNAVVTAAAEQNFQPPGSFSLQPVSQSIAGLSALGIDCLDTSLSNEELVRSLSSMDVNKIADALRALGDAGSSALANSNHLSLHPPAGHTSERAARDSARVAEADRPRTSSNNSTDAQATPVAQHNLQPLPEDSHAYILSRKWLNATKLNEMAQTIGLQYKKGKYSAGEIATLKQAIENYRVRNMLTPAQLNDIIFSKNQQKNDNAFWFEITSTLSQRPVISVYHYVRRSYHPMAQQGKWTDAEDDLLRKAVADLGQSWERVSERVGRMSSDCRDRWRNHIHNREGRVFGAWTQEEEKRLTQIVTEMMAKQHKSNAAGEDNDIFWTQVAERMGSSRGRQQCRIKWTDSLSKRVKNAGVKPRWNQNDAYILVSKIDAQNVNDDSEIDWKELRDENWNLWSAHAIQRRWRTLKYSIKGHEEMSHQEIMDILRVKKANPQPPSNPAKRVTSAAVISAEEQANDVALDDGSFMIPSAPTTSGYEEVDLATNPYMLGSKFFDPSAHPHPFAGAFGSTTAHSHQDFAPSFSEVGPNNDVEMAEGSGEAQEEDEEESSGEEDSSESSESDSDSD